jgi:hypothetical protein
VCKKMCVGFGVPLFFSGVPPFPPVAPGWRWAFPFGGRRFCPPLVGWFSGPCPPLLFRGARLALCSPCLAGSGGPVARSCSGRSSGSLWPVPSARLGFACALWGCPYGPFCSSFFRCPGCFFRGFFSSCWLCSGFLCGGSWLRSGACLCLRSRLLWRCRGSLGRCSLPFFGWCSVSSGFLVLSCLRSLWFACGSCCWLPWWGRWCCFGGLLGCCPSCLFLWCSGVRGWRFWCSLWFGCFWVLLCPVFRFVCVSCGSCGFGSYRLLILCVPLSRGALPNPLGLPPSPRGFRSVI